VSDGRIEAPPKDDLLLGTGGARPRFSWPRGRGVKSGTCIEGLFEPKPGVTGAREDDVTGNVEANGLDTDGEAKLYGVYGVVGGATLPERCFLCRARVRSSRLSLDRNTSVSVQPIKEQKPT